MLNTENNRDNESLVFTLEEDPLYEAPSFDIGQLLASIDESLRQRSEQWDGILETLNDISTKLSYVIDKLDD
nr:MAG TPA: hypothetical protein [Caudoviricetes sp.]